MAASAQQAVNATTESPSSNDSVRVAVSETLTVVDYSYSDGSMRVELRSDLPARVTVSDVFGAIPESGGASRIESRSLNIPRGRSVVRIDAAPYNGLVVVSVSSRGSAVTLAERVDSPIIGGPWGPGDAQAAGLGGLASAFVLVTGYGYRKVKGVRSKPERLL